MTDETALSPDSQPDAVPPTPETTAPDGKVAEGAEAAPDAPDPNLTASGEKLDRPTRNWRALERDRDHWREMAMRQAPPEPPKPVLQASPSPAKTLADFEYDEGKYQSYLFEQAETRAVNAAERKLKENQDQTQARERRSAFATRESSFAKNVEDYHEVAHNAALPITAAMAEVIAESEEGPALAYYLGKNLDKADEIARLSPLVAARELGRLEMKLVSEREKAQAPKVSKAPPPAPKLEGSGDSALEKEPSQMTDTEYAKWRKRQIAQRR